MRRIQHRLGGLGLGLGVAADDRVRREVSHLMEHRGFVSLGDGVDRADVEQAADPIFPAEREDVFGTVDVDLIGERRDLIGNINDPRSVNEDRLIPLGILKKGPERLDVAHVAADIADAVRLVRPLGGED